MTTIKSIFLSLFCIMILNGCSGLQSFSQVSKSFIMNPGSKVFITNLDCNTETCLENKNQLHQRLNKFVKTKLISNGMIIVKDQGEADYNFKFVSAYEGKIEFLNPRNIHLIIQDTKEREIAQLGLSNIFSTPLTEEYFQMTAVERTFEGKLNSVLSTPTLVVQVKN